MPRCKKDRPYWYYEFQIERVQFFGTLTDEEGRPLAKTERRRRAEEREAVVRAQAREQLRAGRQKQRMTLDEAMGRYWVEHAQHLPSEGNIWTYAENWRRIGRNRKPMSLLSKTLGQLSDDDVSWYMSIRRGEPVRNAKPKKMPDGTIMQPKLVSNRTVNADVEFLRDMISHAGKRWSVETGPTPLNWRDHLLDPGGQMTRVLTAEEDESLFDAMTRLRPDFADMFEFAVLGGWRLREVILLEKPKIDRHAMTARVIVKGGREEVKPLTTAMLAIIERNWMHHPTRVFTYVRHKNKTYIQKGARVVSREGQRMPFTKDGWRKQFKVILAEAGIAGFRYHDFRHTFGTRLYRATRDIEVTQRALSHKDRATTQRYVHAAGEFERAGMEAASALRVRTKPGRDDDGGDQNSGGATG